MQKAFAIMLVVAFASGFTTPTFAATIEAKAAYSVAEDNAKAEYKAARERCNSLSGNPKDVCIDEAKLARVRTEADAKAVYKNTTKARTQARMDVANAEYDLAKTKCGSKTGNEKDVCIKEAKAAKTAAQADAKADKKVVDARTDARDDKMTAEYKVAKEKCDALAGNAKDGCMAEAKTRFGK